MDHGGSDAGYRAQFTRFPERGLSVVVLCNLSSIDPERLALRVADLYLGKEPASDSPPPEDPGPADRDVAAFAGLYWNREGDDFRKVVLSEGRLRVLGPGSPPDESLELRPLGGSRFRLSENAEVRFEPSSGGALSLVEKWGETGTPRVYESTASFSPTPDELSQYAGDYESDEIEMIYRMRVEGGRLMLARSRWKKSALEPTISDRFMGLGGQYRFVRREDGAVSGLEIDTGRVLRLRFRRR